MLLALCSSWANAGVHRLEPLVQHNSCTCCWGGIRINSLEVVAEPDYDQCLPAILASSLFMLQALVRNRSI